MRAVSFTISPMLSECTPHGHRHRRARLHGHMPRRDATLAPTRKPRAAPTAAPEGAAPSLWVLRQCKLADWPVALVPKGPQAGDAVPSTVPPAPTHDASRHTRRTPPVFPVTTNSITTPQRIAPLSPSALCIPAPRSHRTRCLRHGLRSQGKGVATPFALPPLGKASRSRRPRVHPRAPYTGTVEVPPCLHRRRILRMYLVPLRPQQQHLHSQYQQPHDLMVETSACATVALVSPHARRSLATALLLPHARPPSPLVVTAAAVPLPAPTSAALPLPAAPWPAPPPVPPSALPLSSSPQTGHAHPHPYLCFSALEPVAAPGLALSPPPTAAPYIDQRIWLGQV
ncbi:hypothetical protein MSAN_02074300 [Mycena sanguinolenta]|uniref:Uncharacterized protein n=1 Tax=Mycena sanguinolenta TaxID=230812 RepID=A0A8H7CL82_9AGAR|nr:hypothetical protein MSAN_02074300 [Mycena sanguinolenta]